MPFTTARPRDDIAIHDHSNDYTGGRLSAGVLAAHTHPWADITGEPTTIGGYGITDFNSLGDARWAPLTAGGYVTLDTAQTITGAKLFEPNTDVIPLSVHGFPLGAANLFEVRDGPGNAILYTTAGGRTLGVFVGGYLVGTEAIATTLVSAASTNRIATFPNATGALLIIGYGSDPPAVGELALVNRTAPISANLGQPTPILLTNVAPAGFYTIQVYMRCTTIGSSPVKLYVSYNDGGVVTNRLLATQQMATAGGTPGDANATLYLASGDITWNTFGWVTGAYTVRIRVTYLGV